MSEKDGELALTEWYPADVKPVREGVYQVDDGDGWLNPWFRYWDGKAWYVGDCTPTNAMFSKTHGKTTCLDPWRGLKERAK